MKTSALIACLCLAAPVPFAAAQHERQHENQHTGSHAAQAAETVNARCPVSNEPITPSAGTVEHKGKKIGFCCPGCAKHFQTWDEARKDGFVASVAAAREHASENTARAGEHGPRAEQEAWTDPYPLDTCPVSGQKLGSMGDPVVKKYDGREVRFCCPPCIERFEADKEAYWKKVDEKIIEDQMRFYPIETCVVSGEPLFDNGEDTATNLVYGNRLVRLCCPMCERDFKADPKKFIDKLNKAAADAQRPDYPMSECVVAGSGLGSMGEPTEMVVAGRLLRFCCAGCEPSVKADPAKFIAAIDKAWREAGKFVADRE